MPTERSSQCWQPSKKANKPKQVIALTLGGLPTLSLLGVGGSSQNHAPSLFPRSFHDLTPNSFEKQLVALRSKATEILYRGAEGGGKPHLMRAAAISGCSVIAGLQVYLVRPI